MVMAYYEILDRLYNISETVFDLNSYGVSEKIKDLIREMESRP